MSSCLLKGGGGTVKCGKVWVGQREREATINLPILILCPTPSGSPPRCKLSIPVMTPPTSQVQATVASIPAMLFFGGEPMAARFPLVDPGAAWQSRWSQFIQTLSVAGLS